MSIPAISNNGNHLSSIENTAKNSADEISKRSLTTSAITETGRTIDVSKQSIKHESPYLEVAKEIGISMIPIYGTIHEFQKGNIGWGIFGAVSDVLSLIPVVGAGCKFTGALVRGGGTAIKGAEAFVATTEAINVTSKIMAKEASRQLAKDSISITSKKLATTSFRAVDPGLELLYKGSKNLTKRVTKSSEKGLPKAAKISSTKTIGAAEIFRVAAKIVEKNASLKSSKILAKDVKNAFSKGKSGSSLSEKTGNILYRSETLGNNISNLLKKSKWRSFDKIEKQILAKEANDLHNNFINSRKGLLDVNHQFLLDLHRSKFVINKEIIAKGSSTQMFQDVKKAFAGKEDNIRLFSAYGNQSILEKPQVVLASKIKNFSSYSSSNAKTVYKAKTLDKGRLKFIAQHTADLHHTDGLKPGGLKSYGVQVKAILSQKEAPKLKYSYYTH